MQPSRRDAADDSRRESPPPSARLTTIDNLAAVAANRHTEEARLGKVVRGELDWIVMKCLEKDRARRYGSAADLSRDIQHYLRDEPIAACPPSKWYRVRKLARKHRGLFLTGTASVLGVLAVVALLVISNSRIRQEQARTGAQKVRADRARVLAETRAEEVRQGLERLKAANAWLERGRWSAEKEQWNEADAAFTKAIELRPEHVAVWIERADLFAQLGLWDLASADFAREFALWEPDTTMRWYRHALLRLSLGDVDGYRQIRTRMRERFRGTVDTHFALETVRASVLGEDPDDVEQLVELAQQCADRAPGNWHELYLLGLAQYRAGSFEESALALRQSLTGLPDWRGRSISYPVLAMAQLQLGNTDDARKSLQSAADAIDRWTQEMYEPPGRRGWAVNQGAAAVWPIVWWDWLECQIYYREAKTLIDGSPPPDDPRLRILHARSLAGLHRNFTADAEYADIVKRWPDDKQFRLEAHRCAGYSAVERREWRTVAAEFASASDLLLADSYLWRFRAIAALAAGDLVTYRQDCAAMLERFAETDDPETAGNVLLVCVLRDDALADMTRLLPLTSVADPLWHWGAWARGATLYRAGRYEESINSFEDASVMYRRNAWDWSFLAMAHHRLGHVDEARRCAREAQRWIAEANRKKPDDFSGTKPAWGGWHEPVVFPLLLREAEELLKTNNDSPTQSADEAAAATGFDG